MGRHQPPTPNTSNEARLLQQLAEIAGQITVLNQRTTAPIGPWIAPKLEGAWVNYGEGYAPAGYMKSNGLVYMQGEVKGGLSGSLLIILPPTYRPKENLNLPIAGGQLLVKPNGEVIVGAELKTALSLSTAPFLAEQ